MKMYQKVCLGFACAWMLVLGIVSACIVAEDNHDDEVKVEQVVPELARNVRMRF